MMETASQKLVTGLFGTKAWMTELDRQGVNLVRLPKHKHHEIMGNLVVDLVNQSDRTDLGYPPINQFSTF
jgi:hypothetical protein